MTSPLAILRASARLYRAQAPLYVGYASWLLLTYAAFVLASFIQEPTVRDVAMIVIQIADTLLWMWAGILLTLITIDVLAGKAPDTAALPRAAWALVWPFAWVSLLQGLVSLGGFLLLVIPGLVFAVWFAYAQQALLVDGKRGVEALSHSRELCRGRFLTVVWNLVAGPLLVGAAYLMVLSATFAIIAAATHVPIDMLVGERPPLWADMIATVSEIFLMPLFYLYWTLSYQELKKSYVGTGDRT